MLTAWLRLALRTAGSLRAWQEAQAWLLQHMVVVWCFIEMPLSIG
jgi:hypothetical protein